ncbi:hypothetical protein OAV13_00360 [bacterium]|nr:hypothetical protein [bacterium]
MLVVFFQGAELKGAGMHFYDIDRCLYFAERMNRQRDYKAVCKPVLRDPASTQVYK